MRHLNEKLLLGGKNHNRATYLIEKQIKELKKNDDVWVYVYGEVHKVKVLSIKESTCIYNHKKVPAYRLTFDTIWDPKDDEGILNITGLFIPASVAENPHCDGSASYCEVFIFTYDITKNMIFSNPIFKNWGNINNRR